MSFYRDLLNGKNTGQSKELELEEQYERLFKKIARDFVSREDLKTILEDFVEALKESNPQIKEALEEQELDFDEISNSRKISKEYSKNLLMPRIFRPKYEDIE